MTDHTDYPMPSQITMRALAELKHRSGNPRTHSPKQIGQIEASIKRHGFTIPILVDGQDIIIAGHGRALAANKLGLNFVPVICRDDMSEADIRAYVIADNKLAENAGWDRSLLAVEFDYLDNLGFDRGTTGFELPEIDIILSELGIGRKVEEVVPAVAATAVNRVMQIVYYN